MTGKAEEQGRVAAFGQAIERAVAAALDRHLPAALDRHLPAAVADRQLDRAGDPEPASLDRPYPARAAAGWIEANYGQPPSGGADTEERKRRFRARMNLWRWRTGRQRGATRRTIEETIRTCGGDPADLPDELPVPGAAGTEESGDG